MRLAWATDLHLDFAGFSAVEAFLASLAGAQADALLITGDIGESATWKKYIITIEERFGKPVWFVLGNHDYYRSNIRAVRERAKTMRWLPAHGAVLLSESTAMVGHDGWGDGRLGDYINSPVILNDYLLIADLVFPNRFLLRDKLERLGDEAADHFRNWIPVAVQRRDRILIATHVPPFKDACWHEGRTSDKDWLPHFSCAAVGDALIEAADAFPDKKFTVLCGHTHGQGYVQMRENLEIFTGGAEYGVPVLQQVFEL